MTSTRAPKVHLPLASLVAAALVFGVTAAHAQEKTKEECIAANESAQTMRTGGKLRDAKAQLLVCIDKTCPSVIRDDCAERLDALDRAIPTIVFTAKGTAGADLTTVVVTMDGVKIAERLDASAIAVDPGEHTFEFSSEGYPPITKKILVREGAKGHQELVDFAPGSGSVAGPPGGGAPAVVDSSSGDTQRIAAYAVGAVGIVGIGLGTVFGLKASSTYKDAESHCPSGPSSCTQEGITGGEDAHTQAAISTASFVVGTVLLGGALVLYFTAPSSSAPKTARAPRGFVGLSPAAGPGAAGLRLGGTF